jgi:hypothetical protein
VDLTFTGILLLKIIEQNQFYTHRLKLSSVFFRATVSKKVTSKTIQRKEILEVDKGVELMPVEVIGRQSALICQKQSIHGTY